MKTVQILEDDDVLTGNEFVRAITFIESENSGCNKLSTYGGMPENNTLWVPFLDVFGDIHVGKTVRRLREQMKGYRYEFVLGEPPIGNIWTNWREERDC